MKTKLTVLQISVEELKVMLNKIDQMYENLKNKFILFTSGQLAYLAYLYGSADLKVTALERLFIPSDLSGQIFYFVGSSLALLSLSFLFQGFFAVSWEIPPQSDDLNNLHFKDEIEILTYLKGEYYNAIKSNKLVYESRYSLYKKGLLTLIIGDIILFIIRFFGNIILN